MAAGAGGIDLVVLVVAADEGVMPQTREHLDICRLLGVRRGLVAVTKSDLLPTLGADWLPLLLEELAAATAGSFLEGAPVVPCSTRDRRGAAGAPRRAGPAGRRGGAAPGRRAAAAAHRPGLHAARASGPWSPARCSPAPSPRVSRWRSSPAAPGREPLRVRTLQVHGAPVKQALAGQRTAVNLPGLEAERGLARPGAHPGRRGPALVAARRRGDAALGGAARRSATAPASCSTSAPRRCRPR